VSHSLKVDHETANSKSEIIDDLASIEEEDPDDENATMSSADTNEHKAIGPRKVSLQKKKTRPKEISWAEELRYFQRIHIDMTRKLPTEVRGPYYSAWTWDTTHQTYYCWEVDASQHPIYDQSGQLRYHWQQNTTTPA